MGSFFLISVLSFNFYPFLFCQAETNQTSVTDITGSCHLSGDITQQLSEAGASHCGILCNHHRQLVHDLMESMPDRQRTSNVVKNV